MKEKVGCVYGLYLQEGERWFALKYPPKPLLEGNGRQLSSFFSSFVPQDKLRVDIHFLAHGLEETGVFLSY